MTGHRDLLPLVEREQRFLAIRRRYLPKSLATGVPWEVLLFVFAEHCRGLTLRMKEVQVGVDVPPTTVLRYVESLEAAGLLVRSLDPADSRGTLVSLSKSGKSRMRGIIRSIAEDLLDPSAGPQQAINLTPVDDLERN